MAEKSRNPDSTFDEIDRLLNDEEFCRELEEWYNNTSKYRNRNNNISKKIS